MVTNNPDIRAELNNILCVFAMQDTKLLLVFFNRDDFGHIAG